MMDIDLGHSRPVHQIIELLDDFLNGLRIAQPYPSLIIFIGAATGKVQGSQIGDLVIYDVDLTVQIGISKAVSVFGQDHLERK